MKPRIENSKKLQLKKQKVATLDLNELSQINGGIAERPRTKHSTENDFTCCWCTGTISSPQA
jgi:hypothetical protein